MVSNVPRQWDFFFRPQAEPLFPSLLVFLLWFTDLDASQVNEETPQFQARFQIIASIIITNDFLLS